MFKLMAMVRLVALGLVACVGVGYAHAQASDAKSACDARMLAFERSFRGGDKVSGKLTQRGFNCGRTLGGRYWGETDIPPRTVAMGLEISINSRPVVIYSSVLAGLGDIKSAQILQKGRSYIVRLIGEGEEPYYADIRLMGGEVVARKVYYPLFQDSAYEETVYHFDIE